MKNKIKKAMFIAWLFLFLIHTGCSKKKYTYYFDHYTAPIKKDTVATTAVEEPPVVFASSEPVITTAEKSKLQLKPVAVKKIAIQEKDSVTSSIEKSKRGAAIVGFTAAALSLPAAILAGVISGAPFVILFVAGIAFSMVGLKSDRRKLAKAGLWIIVGVIAFWLIVGVFFAVSSIFPVYQE